MGSGKLHCVFLSDNRRSCCALGWISGQTYLIKLEDLGDEHYPVISFPSILHLYSYSKLLLSRRADHSQPPLCLLWPQKGGSQACHLKRPLDKHLELHLGHSKKRKLSAVFCGAFAVGSTGFDNDSTVERGSFVKIILFIFGYARSSLLHRLFSSCGYSGRLHVSDAQASHCRGFSCWGAQALGSADFTSAWTLEHRPNSCGTQAWLLHGTWESSLTWDRTRVSCIGRCFLYHLTSWEARKDHLYVTFAS